MGTCEVGVIGVGTGGWDGAPLFVVVAPNPPLILITIKI